MKTFILSACCIFNLSMSAQWNSTKISDEKTDEETHPITYTSKQNNASILKAPVKQNNTSPDLLAHHSNGTLTLHLDNMMPQTNICVFDATGKCVLEETVVKKTECTIDLSSQPKGIYIMEIVSGEDKAVSKIMVE